MTYCIAALSVGPKLWAPIFYKFSGFQSYESRQERDSSLSQEESSVPAGNPTLTSGEGGGCFPVEQRDQSRAQITWPQELVYKFYPRE